MACAHLGALKEEHQVDVCVINGENAAGGFGINNAHVDELLDAGADVITSGNHIWNRKETADFILSEPRSAQTRKLSSQNAGQRRLHPGV